MVSADQCCYLNNVEQTRNRALSTFHFSFTLHPRALLHSLFPLFHLRLLIPVLFLPFFPFPIVLSSFICLFIIYRFLFCHFSSLSQQHIFLLSFVLPFFLLASFFTSPVFFFLSFPVTDWWVIGSCMKRIHMHNNLMICSTHVYDMSDHRIASEWVPACDLSEELPYNDYTLNECEMI